MSSLIFASAFPPIIGYGTYQTLSGYTFGFGIGFPISYLSALSGAVVCFSLSRLFIKARVVKFMARYPNLEAVVKAVEKKGFKVRASSSFFSLYLFFLSHPRPNLFILSSLY